MERVGSPVETNPAGTTHVSQVTPSRGITPSENTQIQHRDTQEDISDARGVKLVFSSSYANCSFLHNRVALVWGTVVRGLRVEIFVRVLRSSRVNLNNVNNTNMFCCV